MQLYDIVLVKTAMIIVTTLPYRFPGIRDKSGLAIK